LNKAIAVLLAFSVLIATGAIIVKAEASDGLTENSWKRLASMPSAGMYDAAVVNDKIYVFGDSVTYEYDPSADTWATKNSKQTPGYFAVAAFQSKVYAFGEATEVYDPVTDTWETKTAMPTVRSQTEANVANGKIYVISGYADDSLGVTSNLNEVYDPATDSWASAASIPYDVVGYASAVVGNKIYVIGGQDNLYWHFTQIYDAESDTWSQDAPIPAATWQAAAGATTGVWAPKRIYVMGGEGGFAEPLNQTFVYDPQTDTWSVGSSLPTGVIDPAVAVVDDLIYVMGGGIAPFTSTAAVERYTPFGVIVVKPEKNGTYFSSSVSLSFTLNKPVTEISYSLDGEANVSITGNITLSGLSSGFHGLRVYATDTFGNLGASETVTFTVATFPTILIAAIVVTVVVAVGLLFYFKKRKR
jgi:N-acetylneuraminic acid mutarotase